MNCCIRGTVKNVGPYLDKIFSNIEQLGALFENYVIIFYYDHSTDNTLQKMFILFKFLFISHTANKTFILLCCKELFLIL